MADLLEKRVDALESRQEQTDIRLSKHDEIILKLQSDITKIDTKMASLATSEQVSTGLAELKVTLITEIKNSVNGILRDALNAIPAKRAVWWAAAGFFAMAVSAVTGILAVVHH